MAYDLTFEKQGDVLYVKVVGARAYETIMEAAKEIFAACAEHETSRAIVDVRELEGRLSSLDMFTLPAWDFPEVRDRDVLEKSAILDQLEFRTSYKFFEMVAVNRGFNLRVFSDYDDAMSWLQDDQQAEADD